MSCPKSPTVFVSVKRNGKIITIPNYDVLPDDLIGTHHHNTDVFKRVIDVCSFHISKDRQRHIKLVNGIELICSDSHGIICVNDGEWYDIFPDDLTSHHNVATTEGITQVESVSHVDKDIPCTFYDIMVEDKLYYVGMNVAKGFVLCYN